MLNIIWGYFTHLTLQAIKGKCSKCITDHKYTKMHMNPLKTEAQKKNEKLFMLKFNNRICARSRCRMWSYLARGRRARLTASRSAQRRSSWQPTRMIGVRGQKCLISGNHIVRTWRREFGLAKEKHSTTTSDLNTQRERNRFILREYIRRNHVIGRKLANPGH